MLRVNVWYVSCAMRCCDNVLFILWCSRARTSVFADRVFIVRGKGACVDETGNMPPHYYSKHPKITDDRFTLGMCEGRCDELRPACVGVSYRSSQGSTHCVLYGNCISKMLSASDKLKAEGWEVGSPAGTNVGTDVIARGDNNSRDYGTCYTPGTGKGVVHKPYWLLVAVNCHFQLCDCINPTSPAPSSSLALCLSYTCTMCLQQYINAFPLSFGNAGRCVPQNGLKCIVGGGPDGPCKGVMDEDVCRTLKPCKWAGLVPAPVTVTTRSSTVSPCFVIYYHTSVCLSRIDTSACTGRGLRGVNRSQPACRQPIGCQPLCSSVFGRVMCAPTLQNQ